MNLLKLFGLALGSSILWITFGILSIISVTLYCAYRGLRWVTNELIDMLGIMKGEISKIELEEANKNTPL